MGREKIVTYCNDRYKGALSEQTCNILEQLIDLDNNNGCVPDLRHIIYNLANSDVTDIIDCGDVGSEFFPDYEKKRGTLRDEQTIGVAYLYYVNNCILGDSVGMGKTVQSAGLINLLKTEYSNAGKDFRYLVLTEKNLASQFRKELVKFTGDYVALLPSGEQRDINKFTNRFPYDEKIPYSLVGTHALFTTPAFLGWLEQSRVNGEGFPFDLLIVDESSCLGNNTTGITKGFKSISKYFKRIVFLNATPFETKLDIFYNQLNLLDSTFLPTKENFKKEYYVMDYRGMFPKPTGKYKNQGQFKQLVGYRYFARTRRSKGAVMDDCRGGLIISELSPIQKEWLQKSQLHRIVYDCPTYFDKSIVFTEENVPKLRSLNELLVGDCAEADTILIFVHFKEAQYCLSEWLKNKGYSNRILNGETDNKDRASIIEGFKNREYRILITNVQKGLNFGDCNYCIFYGYDPNPARMIQFEGRITRSFDIVGKHVYVLCSKGKELQKFNEVVRLRAKSSSEMSNTDISVIMSILLGDID